MKGRVVVYSISGCPFCVRAKTKLGELGLAYIDINLDQYPQRRAEVQERTGRRTVPQIFFNSTHVGGFDDLDKLSKDELDKLIKDVEDNPPPDDAPQPPVPTDATGGEDSDLDFTCELDEYAQLVKDLRESGIVKDHRHLIRTYKNSFIGKEAVDWLVQSKGVDRLKAVEMCKQVVERHFGHAIKKGEEVFKDDNTIYRFLEDDESNALNSGITSLCEPRPASEVAEELRHLILKLYGEYLSPDGKGVDYSAMGVSDKFQSYVKHTAELQRIKLEGMTREEKIAFFINIYNALVIHATVIKGPPVNLWHRFKFFNTISYVIGGHTYSLNEIENGVLRANRKAIGALKKPFAKNDPRLAVALSEPEPKVHFGLVCGAKSCPPIKTYTPKGVNDELKLAAEAFLEGDDGCKLNMAKREIGLSQIFKWYREDFGGSKEAIAKFVLDHMAPSAKRTILEDLLVSENYKVNFMHYNWTINSK